MTTTPQTTVTLHKEVQRFDFRGDEFDIVYHYFIDQATGEEFTTTELDELNMVQVHNKYRAKYGIPFVEEIRSIREQYGLSAAKMSEILGFGTNGYKNYENGEIPSIPHGRYIQLIKDPREFKKLIELNRNELEPAEMEKINRKVNQSLSEYDQWDILEESFLFGDTEPSEFNGFKKPSLEKIGQIVSFFSQAAQAFTTKMNKLLFYADFLHYKRKGYSISGLTYIAITHGPVPRKYSSIYDTVREKGYVDIELVAFGEGVEGERFKPKEKELNTEKFSESEILVLKEVLGKLGAKKRKTVVDISHDEFAWKYNVEDRSPISYEFGFELKHF